jgi:cytochrome c553
LVRDDVPAVFRWDLPMKLLLAAVVATACVAPAAAIDLQAACLDCHRPGQREVPLIEGQHRDYLHNQLSRFRDRHRDVPPMVGITMTFDDARIDALADAVSGRAWQSAPVPTVSDAVQRGRARVVELACTSCHGEEFMGSGDIPRLAGQKPGYLRRQLEAFGEHRYHPPTGVGSRIQSLERQEAADIAEFLHAAGGDAAD